MRTSTYLLVAGLFAASLVTSCSSDELTVGDRDMTNDAAADASGASGAAGTGGSSGGAGSSGGSGGSSGAAGSMVAGSGGSGSVVDGGLTNDAAVDATAHAPMNDAAARVDSDASSELREAAASDASLHDGGAVDGATIRDSRANETGTVSCGSNTCVEGEYCCDKLCGTCAPMGVACTLGCSSF